jgi:2-polyprenyl-6-methoxyphenol hydroxylase-like FAD-dependent oxidoreductase
MYDVIVVGARVAGAPTAMLLARKGYKVLLVDKSTFPSDILSSTLLIWPPGIALLQHWGVLEQLQASHCPPLRGIVRTSGRRSTITLPSLSMAPPRPRRWRG